MDFITKYGIFRKKEMPGGIDYLAKFTSLLPAWGDVRPPLSQKRFDHNKINFGKGTGLTCD